MFSNLTTFRFRVSWFLLTYLAMVAQVALSQNDKNHCRDAKDDSYTEGLIVNWEIIWRSGRKERYPLESTAETQPQTPTALLEIVSDDFPVLSRISSRSGSSSSRSD